MTGGAETSMMRTVQLSIADARYAAALREALSQSGPWQIETVERPELMRPSVAVLDESAFDRVPLPLAHPERVVLITRHDPEALAHAWDAGIMSVVSLDDSPATVLLAIMAAALRTATCSSLPSSEISPNRGGGSAPITPQNPNFRSRRCKIH